MRVNAFALAASSAPLFVAGGATATITGLDTRHVDPASQIGQSGSWAANGYPTDTLDTFRVYVQFNAPATVLAVGDLFIGGTVMDLSTDAPTFFNSINAVVGDNGLHPPGDFTAVPGEVGYLSQWDSYLALGSGVLSLAPGLTTALGATMMGMGGLVGNTFHIDNTGWSTSPPGTANTIFNAQNGFYEVLIFQLSVAEGFDVSGDDIIITTSTANTGPFAFTSIPAPGSLALLGLGAFAGSRRRRE